MREHLDVKKQGSYAVGESLDAKSMDELEKNIHMLEQEIKRIEQEIEKKRASKNLAHNAFKS